MRWWRTVSNACFIDAQKAYMVYTYLWLLTEFFYTNDALRLVYDFKQYTYRYTLQGDSFRVNCGYQHKYIITLHFGIEYRISGVYVVICNLNDLNLFYNKIYFQKR